MAERGQIAGGILDGPLAFDTAVSVQAAAIKRLSSPVAGAADILIVPDLESGNMLAKQLEYLAGAHLAGIVVGAKVPIYLPAVLIPRAHVSLRVQLQPSSPNTSGAIRRPRPCTGWYELRSQIERVLPVTRVARCPPSINYQHVPGDIPGIVGDQVKNGRCYVRPLSRPACRAEYD